jgi:hypothetical protein
VLTEQEDDKGDCGISQKFIKLLTKIKWLPDIRDRRQDKPGFQK